MVQAQALERTLDATGFCAVVLVGVPDRVVLTRAEEHEILADDECDVNDIAPAKWGLAELLLPYERLGYDPWQHAAQVRMTEREAFALAAIERAVARLAAALPDVVMLAFDYDGEDGRLAEQLDRILAPDALL